MANGRARKIWGDFREGSGQFSGRGSSREICEICLGFPVDSGEIALLEGLDGHDRFGVVGVPAFAAALDSSGDLIALALGGSRTDLPLRFEEARVVDQLPPVG